MIQFLIKAIDALAALLHKAAERQLKAGQQKLATAQALVNEAADHNQAAQVAKKVATGLSDLTA